MDILITGHTHEQALHTTEDGQWLVNPGSITGAYSLFHSDVVPSFILMAIQGTKAIAYVYELKGDNVVVSKHELIKAAT